MSKDKKSLKTGIYPRLLQYSKKYLGLFICAMCASILYSGVDAALIKLLQPMVDEVFVSKNESQIFFILLALPCAFFLRGVGSFFSEYFITRASQNIVSTLKMELFAKYQTLPASYYDKTNTGAMLSMLNFNIEQASRATTTVIIDAIRDILLVVFLLATMLWTSWQLTLLFCLVAPGVGLLLKYANNRFRKLGHTIQGSVARLTHVTHENLDGYRVVRAYNAQPLEKTRFKSAVLDNLRQQLKIMITRALTTTTIQFLGGLGLAMIVFFAAYPNSPFSLSAGAFATMMAAIITLLTPFRRLSTTLDSIQQGLAGAESVFAVLDVPSESNHGTITIPDNYQDYSLHFKRLSFHYLPDQPVLEDINLDIPCGKTVALVGHSGSGKSTIVDLLLRLYEGYSGQICLGGIDIADIEMNNYRSQFSYVSQHVTLFDDSLAANIAYGVPAEAICEQRLREAARAACVDEFVLALPNGYQTQIGANGVMLSGGQRQRIAIARALYRNAPIIILDEATSSLDSKSELAIQQAVDTLKQGRTSIIIAHRLSTIENADKIVVLDKGKIQQVGTHVDLLAKPGLYQTLHQSQYRENQNEAVA